MPIYEYTCEACGHDFQIVTTIAEHRRGGVGCPRCRNSLVALNYPDVHANEGRKIACASIPARPEPPRQVPENMPQF